jgi:hypothetical protein
MNSVEGAGPNSLPHHKGRELPQAHAWKPVSTKGNTGPSVCVLASIGDQKRYEHDSLGGAGVVNTITQRGLRVPGGMPLTQIEL